jgi:diguanylate cyclase (GGDEF)-like protein/PAS domain S-box-containing protein
VLHVDPAETLHPALHNWPLPETSAEAFLFRQDGDEVLFLSPLRHEADAALRKRLPLDQPDLLTARVLRGQATQDTAIEGNDYRGVPVLAVARRIGDTEWWMLAKQDRDELMTGAVVSGLTLALAGVLAVFAMGVAVYFYQQRRALLRSARDIEELRQAREALQASERRYRLLADNATDVIWLYDLRQHRFDYVSPSVERLRGYTPAEVLTQSLDEAFTPESAQAMREQLPWRLQAFAGGDVWMRTQIDEVGQRHKAGGSVPTEVVSTLIPNAQGEPVQMLCVARDITTRKQQEAQIVRLSQATEQSPAGVIITNLEGRIEYVNPAFERLTGYTSAEALGRNPRMLQSGQTPPDRYAAMWQALRAGHPWTGELLNRHKHGHDMVQSVTIAPVRDAQGRATHYLSVQLDVTAQRQAEAKAHRLAWFDPLTELPNRPQLLDSLDHALSDDRRRSRQRALLLINVDRFKTLNDALGHTAGDQLLQGLAQRLRLLLQPGDLLARTGADEFALLAHSGQHSDPGTSTDAMHRAHAVHAALTPSFELAEGAVINVTASVGVALLPEGTDDEPSAVLRRADTALHRAKEAGGQQTAFFDADMGQRVSQRFTIEQDLRRGLEAGELRLYLQPQVNAEGHTVGAEALVRWQHPEQGLVPPGLFIPVAEASGLIDQLGTWVLREVCQHLGSLHTHGLRLPIAVNISPRQFHNADFVADLLTLLDRTGAQASDLILEITEGVVVQQIDTVVQRMGELTGHGVRFSIDDFGTGYSSLSYLKRLPIHELKIDRSFVQDAPSDPSDAALVEAILSVASHLRLRVVAEGVETPEQAAFFTRHPGVLMQGYLFGRPEPAQGLVERWRLGHSGG